MLTLFAIPKPFQEHFDIIQRNAIRSWLQLGPRCEVILLGTDEGTAEVASELRVRHLAQITRNEYGTPLVNSVFGEAEKAARHPYLCYVNADILLLSDFLPAVERVIAAKSRFLGVGRRWDVGIRELLPFSDNWESQIRLGVTENGKLHAHTGADYFVFPRGLWGTIPPFAIGRTAWDSWLIYRARSLGAPVIDFTEEVTAVHQNHDYSHSSGGEAATWKGPEATKNFALAGGYPHLFTLLDADYRLTKRCVRRKITPYYFYRQLVTLSESHPSARWMVRWIRASFGFSLMQRR